MCTFKYFLGEVILVFLFCITDSQGAENCHFALATLQSQFRGEELRGVPYLNSNQREKYWVEFKHGRAWIPGKGPLSTQRAKGFSGHGIGIFVMDRSGNFYVAAAKQNDNFYHSSLVAGEPVAGAGEIGVYHGVIFYLSRTSGHYTPGPRQMGQVIGRLHALGIDTKNIIYAEY